MIKLIGIIVIAAGFALRLNTLLVVLLSGIVTGLVSGMSFNEVMEEFGRLFVTNRYMALPIVMMLPVVGLLERYGLRERAETLIRRSAAATAGRVLLLYMGVRQVSIALGINIGGHAGAVRPLVAPLAEGAARVCYGSLSKAMVERIRAHAAAAENVGNFFGEDIFIAVGSILLMKGFFDGMKIEVSTWAMALWGIPPAARGLRPDGLADSSPGSTFGARGSLRGPAAGTEAREPDQPEYVLCRRRRPHAGDGPARRYGQGPRAAVEHGPVLGPLGVSFAFGGSMPPAAVGYLVLGMAMLTASGGVGASRERTTGREERLASAERLGNRLFWPALLVPATAVFGSLFFGRIRWHGVSSWTRPICRSHRSASAPCWLSRPGFA